MLLTLWEPRIRGLPIYPPLLAVAFVISEFANSNGPVEVLARPLIVAAGISLAVQLVLSAVSRNLDRGAFFASILLAVIAAPSAALAMSGGLLVATLVAIRRKQPLASMPWARATGLLNLIGGLTLAVVVATGASAGAFTSPVGAREPSVESAMVGLPDIYLIMLDGYPRLDTLEAEFDFDNRPFLRKMEALDFYVASKSHSNYTMTVLSLASMMNGAHIRTLVTDPPSTLSAQFRTLARHINAGTNLGVLRRAGYQIVSISSGYNESSLLSADRYLDSGELSTFEMSLLTRGGMRQILSVVGRSWLPDQHRSRIMSTFQTLGELANERSTGPKFVLAHLMTPHMPVAFTRDGGAADPWPCFPASCSLYDFGDAQGGASPEAIRDQILWINSAVERTARAIQARSARPPVIVIFSDHGLRHRYEDRDELFRSLFMASTPGRSDVFPDDVTPVNLLTRLINAYMDSGLPLASEESFWSETRNVGSTGLLQHEAWPAN